MEPSQDQSFPKQDFLKSSLPQLYQALLTASCLSNPDDPIGFLESKLTAFQGHHNIQDIDWHKFANDAENQTTTSEADTLPPHLFEKAYSCYQRHVSRHCFRGWTRYVAERKRNASELQLKIELAEKHRLHKCQGQALTVWLNWLRYRKKTQAAAVVKLRKVSNAVCLKRALVVWGVVLKNTRRTREYLEKLEKDILEMSSRDHQVGEGCDGLSMLPTKLAHKIFQHLGLRDLLTCAQVCNTWKAITRSGLLWSRVNFSVEKTRITDVTVRQVLQKYRPFVINLNLRGCTSLTWNGLTHISECRNLQEVNVSECSNITDLMVQRLVEGCPNLLYLNLSCTLVTNEALRALARSALNLQYLSLAYCYRFTDKGLKYFTTGKGCHGLVHLNLSGCTQMTVEGFRHVSDGCPSLREVVIDEMTTLSDKCVLALVAGCSLSAVSLLDTPHLSDAALQAIARASNLEAFSTEGNGRVTDAAWTALCRGSPGLRRLHAAACPQMTDASLKAVSALKSLQYLDVSHCSRLSDVGMRYLTKGVVAAQVRELNVSHCGRLNDLSVTRIAQRLSTLYHLNLSHCVSLTDGCLQTLSNSCVCSLDISGCTISDQGLAALGGSRLRKLVLSECVYVTDLGVEKLFKQTRRLELVDISRCVGLSDQAIKALSVYCRGLDTLRMAGCPKMTDTAVQHLTAARYLRALDVSGCVLLTDGSLRLLERCCPPLVFIAMAYCSGVSKRAALRLQPRVHHWEHSTDDPPHWFGYNNMGQMLEPIRRPSKSDVTREEEPEEQSQEEQS